MTETSGVYSPTLTSLPRLDTSTKFSNFHLTYHPDYLAQLPVWNYLHDLYHGVDCWLELTDSGFKPTNKTSLFLPKHVAESHENWVSRINATYYDDLFAKALRRFVDLIFRPGVSWSAASVPSATTQAETKFLDDYKNLDSEGSSGDTLLSAIALSAMLYGHTYVLVDFPSIEARNYREFLEENLRPYWVEVLPQNLINWETEIINGQVAFTYALVKSEGLVTHNHQAIAATQYYEFSRGSWLLWQEVAPYDGKHFAIAPGGSGETGLDYIPLVPVYGGYPTGFCRSLPPLRSLADKNRTLYQLTSDHLRKMSLCCHPVPVLKDLMRGDEPLEIGPNSFIQLRDPGGSFEWKEPLALSLQQSRKDLTDLRQSIADDSANFLTSPSDRQSATATQLIISPLEASLASFVRSFSSGINNCIKIHNDYLQIQDNLEIVLQYDIFPDSQKDSQSAFAIQGLYTSGLIGREAALRAIAQLGLLGTDFDLAQEIISNDRFEPATRPDPPGRTKQPLSPTRN